MLVSIIKHDRGEGATSNNFYLDSDVKGILKSVVLYAEWRQKFGLAHEFL